MSAGAVDRAALARRVRRRRSELRWLEKLTHPLVAKDMRRKIESAPTGSVVVCEVPLLFEAGYEGMFDLIVTIEAGSETRRWRSVHGFDLGQFTEFESLQASTEQRVARSDVVFFNDGTSMTCVASWSRPTSGRALYSTGPKIEFSPPVRVQPAGRPTRRQSRNWSRVSGAATTTRPFSG